MSRKSLIESHITLVRKITNMMARKLPAHIQKADLEQEGYVALCRAADKYDPSLGVQFNTFASKRILGAMQDYLRDLDFGTRGMRETERKIATARKAFIATYNRKPTDAELASATGLTARAVADHALDFHRAMVGSLDWMSEGADDEGCTIMDKMHDHDADPTMNMMRSAQASELAAALGCLNERERTLIALYYYDNMKMQEIAEMLGITESRVSQLHSGALAKLKTNLESPAALAIGA